MKQNMKLVVKCLRLELDNRKLKMKNSKLKKERDEYKENSTFLTDENIILKKYARRKYHKISDKTSFLVEREKKLQTIEQMVANKEDFRKIRAFIKGE